MCQLCALQIIALRDRWPKPLEPLVADLNRLLLTAHREATALQTQLKAFPTPAGSPNASASASASASTLPTTTTGTTDLSTPADESLTQTYTSLIETIKALLTLLKLLDRQREEWWASKRDARRKWAEEGLADKLTGLQVVNNKAAEMIRDMRARVGGFCRWGLETEVGELEGELGGGSGG